jgi:inner membrane transporter RhtA
LSPLDRVPAPGLVLGSVTAFQFGTAYSVTLIHRLGVSGTSFIRLLFAAVVLIALVRPSLRGRGQADLGLTVLFGCVLGAINLALFAALRRVPLGVAITVQFCGPLGIAVAGSRRRLDVAWVGMAALGIVLLAKPGGVGAIDGLGLALTATAAACWALYIVLAQRLGQRFAGGQGLAPAMAVAALVALAPAVATAGARLARPSSLALGAGAGALLALPYMLEMEALRRIPRSVFGVLMSLEPAAAALAGFVILGQRLDALDVLGILLVVGASAGALRAAA